MAARRLRRRRRRRRAGRRRHRLGPGARGLPRRRARRGRPRRAREPRQLRAGLGAEQGPGPCAPMPAGPSARPNAWAGFAQTLKEETGLDVCFQRPGGFHLSLSERELEARANSLKRLHNQPGIVDYKTEILDHAAGGQDAARHRARGGGRQLLPARRPRELAAPVPHPAHRASTRRGVDLPAEPSRREHHAATAASSGSTTEHGEIRAGQGRAGGRQRQHAAGADGRARSADAARARPDHRHRAAAAVPAAIPSSPCARPTRAR